MSRSKPKNAMADRIRRAFRTSGLSVKRLAELANVPYASCHGFLAGQRDPTLSTAAKIASVLGLKLVAVKPRQKKG